ncbi:MAG: BatD family protein [Verrucomicrobiota bacterium]|nr:MAG: BatD family protein [Verrucomicrobiota bacterium]
MRCLSSLIVFLWTWLVISTSAIAGASKTLAEGSVEARFEPNRITLSDEARYVIAFTNIVPSSFRLPNVPGLQQFGENTQQSVFSANGRVVRKTHIIYSFVAEHTGTFTMPAFDIAAEDEVITIPPSTLTVTEDAHGHQTRQEMAGGIEATLNVATTEAYVGQRIPIQIALRITGDDTQLLRCIPPETVNGHCILGPLGKEPKEGYQNGAEVFTWTTWVTPIKSGDLSLAFKTTCLCKVVQPLGLFAMASQVQRELETNIIPLKVAALPSPAPESFSGAIGDFSFQNFHLSSDRTLAGEPITLSIDLCGEGNFDRIQAPALLADETWKCFEPKTKFKEMGPSNGQKTFEYVIIPQKTGELVLPTIKFGYFSPTEHAYRELEVADTTKILVSRSTNALVAPPAPVAGSVSSSSAAPALHLLTQDTWPYRSLSPWILQSCIQRWLIAIIAAFLLITTLSLWKKHSQVAPQKSKKLPRLNLKKERQQLVKMLHNNDVDSGYKAALQLLNRTVTGNDFEKEISRAKILDRCQAVAPEQRKWLEEFLNEADDVVFGQKHVLKLYATRQIDTLLRIIPLLKKSS